MNKNMVISKFILWVIILLTGTISAQIYNTRVAAEIVLERNTEFISVTGFAYNKTEINHSLRYVLSVISQDPETLNRAKNDQAGRFVLQPGEKQELSKTTLSAKDTTQTIILLLIYDLEEQLLGKDRIVLNDDSEETIIVIPPEEARDVMERFAKSDGVELRGIVLGDTKTKPGRDFYSMYHSAYLVNNINGPEIVSIKEELTIGNNTVIKIVIGDDTIMAFFVQPKNDYIQAMSYEAIKRTIAYFERRKDDKGLVKFYK
jgi:hypothetical protein